jgi:hypothetical protein
MIKVLRILKRIWVINFLRRIYFASKYYNYKYLQILKWGIKSKEHTNYTFHLTPENLVCLAQTISLVSGKGLKEISAYITELENDMDLKNHIRNTTFNSNEKSFADLEIRFSRRIGWYALARAMKPKVIIETGVDKGLGSVLLCSALIKNKTEGFEGKFYGTDINPAAGYLLNGKYSEVGQILYGDSIETLSKFNKQIDLFINDSDHSAEYEYIEYKTIASKLSKDAIILGDNSHVTSKLSQFSLENNRKYIFFHEVPLNHWYPGAGIGISFK